MLVDNNNVVLADCDCADAKLINFSAITTLLSVLFHSSKEKFFAGAENTAHGTAKINIASAMSISVEAMNIYEAAQARYAGGLSVL